MRITVANEIYQSVITLIYVYFALNILLFLLTTENLIKK